jgi:hypothetical protein
MQFSPTSRRLIPLLSKYSLQQPVLKHPQSMFLPYITWFHSLNISYGHSATIMQFECELISLNDKIENGW